MTFGLKKDLLSNGRQDFFRRDASCSCVGCSTWTGTRLQRGCRSKKECLEHLLILRVEFAGSFHVNLVPIQCRRRHVGWDCGHGLSSRPPETAGPRPTTDNHNNNKQQKTTKNSKKTTKKQPTTTTTTTTTANTTTATITTTTTTRTTRTNQNHEKHHHHQRGVSVRRATTAVCCHSLLVLDPGVCHGMSWWRLNAAESADCVHVSGMCALRCNWLSLKRSTTPRSVLILPRKEKVEQHSALRRQKTRATGLEVEGRSALPASWAQASVSCGWRSVAGSAAANDTLDSVTLKFLLTPALKLKE